jgi:hypothetical protein
VLRETVGPETKKEQETGENYIKLNSILCVLGQFQENEMGSACGTYGGEKTCIQVSGVYI